VCRLCCRGLRGSDPPLLVFIMYARSLFACASFFSPFKEVGLLPLSYARAASDSV
jgi:hypothetical protein